ncbi:MAG: protoporphyrinogen oxidase [Cyanobacteria bacterium SIG32]|nr:protoporphyrinogen oxidase [Cyanobacteria bacterium SIG32]
MTLDKMGAVLATKVLCDNDVVAEDVSITLPDINFVTSEVNGLGKINIPTCLTEALQSTITSVGMDRGFFNMLGLSSKTFEYRFVKSSLDTSGDTGVKGYKAFLKGLTSNIPGGGVEPGSSWSGDVTFEVTRYQLYADGVEKILIDKIKGICKINGKDYAKEIQSLL